MCMYICICACLGGQVHLLTCTRGRKKRSPRPANACVYCLLVLPTRVSLPSLFPWFRDVVISLMSRSPDLIIKLRDVLMRLHVATETLQCIRMIRITCDCLRFVSLWRVKNWVHLCTIQYECKNLVVEPAKATKRPCKEVMYGPGVDERPWEICGLEYA